MVRILLYETISMQFLYTMACFPPLNTLKQIHIISVEGGIASGKSTVMEKLRVLLPSAIVVPERVSTWQGNDPRCNANIQCNVLQAFYDDPYRNAHTLQSLILHTRMFDLHQALREADSRDSDNVVIITERSLLSDRIFAEHAFNSGHMNASDWYVYNVMWQDCCNVTAPYMRGHIVLDVDAMTSLNRMSCRDRMEESNVELLYLKKLLEFHLQVFDKKDPHTKWILNEADKLDQTVERAREAVTEILKT